MSAKVIQSGLDRINDKTTAKDNKSLPDKLFSKRESILTELFQNLHFRVLYNIGLLIFIGTAINSILYNYSTKGTLNFGQVLIKKCFNKLHIVIVAWFINFLSSLLCYPGFRFWIKVRLILKPSSVQLRVWDRLGILTTIFYYFGIILFIPGYIAWESKLNFGSAIIVACESVRLLMKCHAFIRSNVPSVLSFKPHTEKQLTLPGFKNYLYFLFIPTLVYQNEYPKTERIRWKYVAQCFTEFLLCVFFLSIIIDEYYFEKLRNLCLEKMPWFEIPLFIVMQALMSLLVMNIFFYMLLHAWMNAFAEMLRFGDRLFYKDWWTSTSFQRFYRTWNSPVHDWLYIYILKDFYEIITPQNKMVSRIMVVFISAIFHEYIIIISCRIFFPFLFFTFLIPSIVFWMFKENRHWSGNLSFLYCQSLGLGMQIILYGAEYMARVNSPPEESNWYNTLVPKLLRCDCFS